MAESLRTLHLPSRLRRKMLKHVRSVLPEEACGFLAGNQTAGIAVLPVKNELHSPVRFQMEPLDEYKALEWIDGRGLEILAIYHSHPAGPAEPSVTDLAEHMFPDAWCMIWSPSGSRWRARCFAIKNGQFEELSIVIGVNNGVPGE